MTLKDKDIEFINNMLEGHSDEVKEIAITEAERLMELIMPIANQFSDVLKTEDGKNAIKEISDKMVEKMNNWEYNPDEAL